MRVSTAITVALTVLLATSFLGVVAATPIVSDNPSPKYDQTDTVVERSPPPLERAQPSRLSTDSRGQSIDPSLSPVTAAQSTSPLDQPNPKQVIRITVLDNGDVRWTIESRFLLTNDSDTAVFEEYAAAVSGGHRDVGLNPETFETFRQTAQRETGREMSIEDAHWNDPHIVESSDSTDLSEETLANDENVRIGIISYSFTWTNFATVDGDRIHFGDAFQTESGPWIGLGEGQRLVIETQSDFALETPTRLTWNGPYEFTDDELEIVFVQTGNILGWMSWWLIGGLLTLLVIGTSGYLLTRQDRPIDLPIPTARFPSLAGVLNADNRPTSTKDRSNDTDATPTRSNSDTDGSLADDTARETGMHLEFEESVDDEIDPELLSDEERVHRLLKQNGGRMKQASIVSETGWSNAKVSQLLSKMDDDDEIEKLRIGRENLITLPGVDPTEVE